MARALSDVVATLPKWERGKIKIRARKLIAEEISVRDPSKAVARRKRDERARLAT